LKNPRDGKLYLTVSRRGLKNSLEYVYEKYTNGKKLPSAYLSEGDFQNALKGYKGLKKAHYKNLESDINDLGYQHLGRKSFKIAIQAFRINVSLFPDSANAYDSLGESYMKHGEKEKAIVNYKRALELNPQNKSARQILKKLQMQ
jgi:tetratricopeptide (TPR) repeat protein